jgi:hypothetical protein
MDSIICPHCQRKFAISQALRAQLEKDLLAKEAVKHQEELEKIRKETLAEAEKKVKDALLTQLKRMDEDNLEKEERIKKLLEQLSSLTDELRRSKRERDEAEFMMKKKLAEEEEKIRLEAQKKAEERERLKILEKEKQLESALKEADELRRKLQQGSQQMQGEAFEVAFESLLKQHYANDKIIPVGKGVRGGDVIQEVIDARGNYVGKILWEVKNTKAWGTTWISKLKLDKRQINADEAVIISEVLPTSTKTAGFFEGIWVTKQDFVVPLADTLRAKLIQMHYVRNSVKAKDQKMEVLYSYLSGTEFRHRVEAIIEAFTRMQEEIEKEKRYFQNKWARDEKNIRQVIDNTYGMHGDFKGIVGASLPQIRGIDLLEDGGK